MYNKLMNNAEYLKQISSETRPVKKSMTGLFSPKVFIALGAAVLLAIIIMIFAALGGDKNSEIDLLTKINLRSDNLVATIDEYAPDLKASSLRQITASLRTVLKEAAGTSSSLLTEEFDKKDAKKVSKKLAEDESSYIEEVNSTLEEARLNGLLDREFLRQFTLEIGLLMSLESECIDRSKKEAVDNALNASYENLDKLHEEFENYSNATT